MHYTLNSGVSISTTTFKCEGCGLRFISTSLYNYSSEWYTIAERLDDNSICTGDEHAWFMIRMYCSHECFSKGDYRISYEIVYRPWIYKQLKGES